MTQTRLQQPAKLIQPTSLKQDLNPKIMSIRSLIMIVTKMPIPSTSAFNSNKRLKKQVLVLIISALMSNASKKTLKKILD